MGLSPHLIATRIAFSVNRYLPEFSTALEVGETVADAPHMEECFMRHIAGSRVHRDDRSVPIYQGHFLGMIHEEEELPRPEDVETLRDLERLVSSQKLVVGRGSRIEEWSKLACWQAITILNAYYCAKREG